MPTRKCRGCRRGRRRSDQGGSPEKESGSDREAEEISKLGDKPRSQQQQQQQQQVVHGTNYLQEGRTYKKSRTLLSRRKNLLSRRLHKIRPNERSSGSLCMAAARGAESARAGVGSAEVGELDPRRERARNEGRRPETGGQRIPV